MCTNSICIGMDNSRLDLTAPTRHMGPRRLLKQGPLMKAKSRRKLHAFLCSDILVLLDESMKNLYRMVRFSLTLIPSSLTEEGYKNYSLSHLIMPRLNLDLEVSDAVGDDLVEKLKHFCRRHGVPGNPSVPPRRGFCRPSGTVCQGLSAYVICHSF